MQKWEYLIVNTGILRTERICYINGERVSCPYTSEPGNYAPEQAVLSRLFNQYGEQGWEFVGGNEEYIFKRPK